MGKPRNHTNFKYVIEIDGGYTCQNKKANELKTAVSGEQQS